MIAGQLRRGIAAGALAIVAGCQTIPADAPRATASLQPTRGSTVSGTASFVQVDGKVRVTANVRGLKPNAEFGFHVHEAGDCSSGDGMSTKGHFNPYGKAHAHAGVPERHAGDLPSLKSDASGNAALEADVDIITVAPGPASIVGRGLIVHAQPDDYKTQPTGNAGARSACAVIQRS
jgi:Cu-Zn family superoxide dismutase